MLVTGGASGLGRAITERLARESGHRVYFTYMGSKESAQELSQVFPNTRGFECDFKSRGSLSRLAEEIPSLNLDVLINNAFVGFEKKHFHKIEADRFVENFENNILPAILLTQAALPSFRAKKFGKIITVLTAYLLNRPPVGLSSYVAEKAYLLSLSKSWARENSAFNITSNCISPSMMLTRLNADMDSRFIEQEIAAHPLRRLLTAEETAEAVRFLVDCTQHVSGINLAINGGSDVV